MTITTINPTDVRLRHGVGSDRLSVVMESMSEHGWDGRPVVLYEWDGALYNITGCHRISAAVELEMDEIPAVVIRPVDEDELDRIEYAAANDDIEAASVVRCFFSVEIGDLVEQG